MADCSPLACRTDRVAFGGSGSPTTTVTFSEPGTYVLRLKANDGQLAASDLLVVTIPMVGTRPLITSSPIELGPGHASNQPGRRLRGELLGSGGPQTYDQTNDRLILFRGQPASPGARADETRVLVNASGVTGTPAWATTRSVTWTGEQGLLRGGL